MCIRDRRHAATAGIATGEVGQVQAVLAGVVEGVDVVTLQPAQRRCGQVLGQPFDRLPDRCGQSCRGAAHQIEPAQDVRVRLVQQQRAHLPGGLELLVGQPAGRPASVAAEDHSSSSSGAVSYTQLDVYKRQILVVAEKTGPTMRRR